MTGLEDPPLPETYWDRSRRQRIEELSAENRDLRAAAAAFTELRDRVVAAHAILEERRHTSAYVRRVLHALDGT